ncbi:hypothetical protein N2152v2_005593 [Parachlorella kessleri]
MTDKLAALARSEGCRATVFPGDVILFFARVDYDSRRNQKIKCIPAKVVELREDDVARGQAGTVKAIGGAVDLEAYTPYFLPKDMERGPCLAKQALLMDKFDDAGLTNYLQTVSERLLVKPPAWSPLKEPAPGYIILTQLHHLCWNAFDFLIPPTVVIDPCEEQNHVAWEDGSPAALAAGQSGEFVLCFSH